MKFLRRHKREEGGKVIGPKCQRCRKGLRHHRMMDRACPIGKKSRTLGFTQFHASDTFQAKEPKPKGGSEKRKDRRARRECKANPCCACGTKGTDWNPVDPAHVKTFKVSQSDDPRNMVPLCRQCHQMQHREGWYGIMNAYPSVIYSLIERGWNIDRDPFRKDRVILSHGEIA